MLRLRFSVLLFCVSSCLFAQDPLPRKTILNIVNSSRSQLSNEYHLEILIDSHQLVPERGEPYKEQVQLSIWSQGKKLRTDARHVSTTRANQNLTTRTIYCRNCERSGYGVFTTVGAKTSISEVQFFKISEGTFDKIDAWKIDWRGLGLLAGDMNIYRHVPTTTQLEQLAKVEAFQISETSLEDLKCYLASVDTQGKAATGYRRIWFSPSHGMNPVRFEDVTQGKRSSKTVTTIEYQRVKNSLTWYPQKIQTSRERDGTKILTETVEIRKAGFGDVLPESTFQLAGLDLENGQPVAFPEIKRNNDYPVWRNGQLDRKYTAQMQTLDAIEFRDEQIVIQAKAQLSESHRNQLLLIFGIILAACGMIVLFVRNSHLRRKKLRRI
jgi:hypothetical protein